jgi:hypothetical protein
MFLLRSNEGQAYQVGRTVDAMLCYFIFRGLVGDMEDFRWFLSAFAIMLIPYVALLLVETLTNHNPFSLLGGEVPPVNFREGRIRCFGSFRNASVLGSLGASFFPLYIGLFLSKSRRVFAIIGTILSLGIVWFSNSGGPLGFTMVGVLGWISWLRRGRMRLIRRVGVILIAVLVLIMKAPIWYLPAKFGFITGGDAWHRAYLMDVAFQHLKEWWLWGMPEKETSEWLPYTLDSTHSADISNQFISLGLAAGLMAIALFVWLFIRVFRSLGKELSATRLASPRPCGNEYLLWGLGVMLAGHVVNLLGITYFDQFYVIWFMQLALISTLTHQGRPAPISARRMVSAAYLSRNPFTFKKA